MSEQEASVALPVAIGLQIRAGALDIDALGEMALMILVGQISFQMSQKAAAWSILAIYRHKYVLFADMCPSTSGFIAH